jgi:hypothetical protein
MNTPGDAPGCQCADVCRCTQGLCRCAVRCVCHTTNNHNNHNNHHESAYDRVVSRFYVDALLALVAAGVIVILARGGKYAKAAGLAAVVFLGAMVAMAWKRPAFVERYGSVAATYVTLDDLGQLEDPFATVRSDDVDTQKVVHAGAGGLGVQFTPGQHGAASEAREQRAGIVHTPPRTVADSAESAA